MESNVKKPKNGVARLRERFFEIKRNIKITPELEDAVKGTRPSDEKKESGKTQKKIAAPKTLGDLDL